MKLLLFLTITLLFISCSTSAIQKAPEQQVNPTKAAERPNPPFVLDESIFDEIVVKDEPRLTAQEAGTDIPIDVLPARDCYYLKDKRPLPALEQGPRYFYPAQSTICIIPLKDSSVGEFRRAYPQLNEAMTKLQKLLARRSMRLKPDDIPDMPLNNASQSMVSKVQYLDFPQLSGIIFLTQYSQEMEPNPLNNEELTYNFQGITKDKKYYVSARFAVTHPALPKGIDFTGDVERDRKGLYLRRGEKALERLSPETFEPRLKELQKLISTIRMD